MKTWYKKVKFRVKKNGIKDTRNADVNQQR